MKMKLSPFVGDFVPAQEWKNINFALYKSKLARLQYFCDCKAGAGIINPCAHIAALIILLWAVLNEELEELTKISKRDKRIKEKVVDLTKAKEWREKNVPQIYCICKEVWDPKVRKYMIECESCTRWLHPQCVGARV